MRLRRGDGYWLLIGGPVPPGSAAITVGRLISVRERSADSPSLLRHELVHVSQWCRQGVIRFVMTYLGAYVRLRLQLFPHRAAYRRIPQEIEATWLSRQPEAFIDMSDRAAIFL